MVKTYSKRIGNIKKIRRDFKKLNRIKRSFFKTVGEKTYAGTNTHIKSIRKLEAFMEKLKPHICERKDTPLRFVKEYVSTKRQIENFKKLKRLNYEGLRSTSKAGLLISAHQKEKLYKAQELLLAHIELTATGIDITSLNPKSYTEEFEDFENSLAKHKKEVIKILNCNKTSSKEKELKLSLLGLCKSNIESFVGDFDVSEELQKELEALCGGSAKYEECINEISESQKKTLKTIINSFNRYSFFPEPYIELIKKILDPRNLILSVYLSLKSNNALRSNHKFTFGQILQDSLKVILDNFKDSLTILFMPQYIANKTYGIDPENTRSYKDVLDTRYIKKEIKEKGCYKFLINLTKAIASELKDLTEGRNPSDFKNLNKKEISKIIVLKAFNSLGALIIEGDNPLPTTKGGTNKYFSKLVQSNNLNSIKLVFPGKPLNGINQIPFLEFFDTWHISANKEVNSLIYNTTYKNKSSKNNILVKLFNLLIKKKLAVVIKLRMYDTDNPISSNNILQKDISKSTRLIRKKNIKYVRFVKINLEHRKLLNKLNTANPNLGQVPINRLPKIDKQEIKNKKNCSSDYIHSKTNITLKNKEEIVEDEVLIEHINLMQGTEFEILKPMLDLAKDEEFASKAFDIPLRDEMLKAAKELDKLNKDFTIVPLKLLKKKLELFRLILATISSEEVLNDAKALDSILDEAFSILSEFENSEIYIKLKEVDELTKSVKSKTIKYFEHNLIIASAEVFSKTNTRFSFEIFYDYRLRFYTNKSLLSPHSGKYKSVIGRKEGIRANSTCLKNVEIVLGSTLIKDKEGLIIDEAIKAKTRFVKKYEGRIKKLTCKVKPAVSKAKKDLEINEFIVDVVKNDPEISKLGKKLLPFATALRVYIKMKLAARGRCSVKEIFYIDQTCSGPQIIAFCSLDLMTLHLTNGMPTIDKKTQKIIRKDFYADFSKNIKKDIEGEKEKTEHLDSEEFQKADHNMYEILVGEGPLSPADANIRDNYPIEIRAHLKSSSKKYLDNQKKVISVDIKNIEKDIKITELRIKESPVHGTRINSTGNFSIEKIKSNIRAIKEKYKRESAYQKFKPDKKSNKKPKPNKRSKIKQIVQSFYKKLSYGKKQVGGELREVWRQKQQYSNLEKKLKRDIGIKKSLEDRITHAKSSTIKNFNNYQRRKIRARLIMIKKLLLDNRITRDIIKKVNMCLMYGGSKSGIKNILLEEFPDMPKSELYFLSSQMEISFKKYYKTLNKYTASIKKIFKTSVTSKNKTVTMQTLDGIILKFHMNKRLPRGYKGFGFSEDGKRWSISDSDPHTEEPCTRTTVSKALPTYVHMLDASLMRIIQKILKAITGFFPIGPHDSFGVNSLHIKKILNIIKKVYYLAFSRSGLFRNASILRKHIPNLFTNPKIEKLYSQIDLEGGFSNNYTKAEVDLIVNNHLKTVKSCKIISSEILSNPELKKNLTEDQLTSLKKLPIFKSDFSVLLNTFIEPIVDLDPSLAKELIKEGENTSIENNFIDFEELNKTKYNFYFE